MPKMTSGQIKTALQQQADFHAAVVRAAEILEAVEAGEKQLKDLDRQKAAKEADMEKLGNLETEYRDKEAEYRANFQKVVQGLEKQREDLAGTIVGLRKQRDEEAQSLREVVQKKTDQVAALNKEVQAAQDQLGKVRAEIDRLKKTFAA